MASNVVKYSLLAFPLASCGLGYWQIRRLEWKKGLIADLERQMREQPMELTDLISQENIDHLEYRRVKALGHFDTDLKHQLYLKPRQLVVNEEAVLRDTNQRVLVNRGWLASKGKDSVQDHVHKGMSKDTHEITGVIRSSQKHTTYGVNNDETQHEWHIRDIGAMARRLDTAPVLLDLDPDPKRIEGPIGGQTQLNIRNEHLNYAITWFSLAVLSWMMWYTKYGKRSLYGNTKFGHR